MSSFQMIGLRIACAVETICSDKQAGKGEDLRGFLKRRLSSRDTRKRYLAPEGWLEREVILNDMLAINSAACNYRYEGDKCLPATVCGKVHKLESIPELFGILRCWLHQCGESQAIMNLPLYKAIQDTCDHIANEYLFAQPGFKWG